MARTCGIGGVAGNTALEVPECVEVRTSAATMCDTVNRKPVDRHSNETMVCAPLPLVAHPWYPENEAVVAAPVRMFHGEAGDFGAIAPSKTMSSACAAKEKTCSRQPTRGSTMCPIGKAALPRCSRPGIMPCAAAARTRLTYPSGRQPALQLSGRRLGSRHDGVVWRGSRNRSQESSVCVLGESVRRSKPRDMSSASCNSEIRSLASGPPRQYR